MAAVDAIEKIEDGIYVVVAVLLVIAAVFLLGSVVMGFYQDLSRSRDGFTVVLDVLDRGLVLFIIAELLHTVRITIRERTLAAEPFLIVGLIAGVRRLLILTAQAAEGRFNWNPQGIELALLIGLILVMTVAILLWRRWYVPIPGGGRD